MIILNERKFALNALETRDLGSNRFRTLCTVAKYYLSNGENKTSARKLLEVFLLECIPSASVVEWRSTLDSAIRCATRFPLVEIDEITISENELDTIRSLPKVQLQRLAFTLLCISKYWDEITPNRDHWVNTPDSEIMNMANINTSLKRQSVMYSEIRDAGLIRFSKRVDNTNVQVLFADNNPPMMHITDFRNLGYQYMNLSEPGFYQCVNCGLIVKERKNTGGTRVGRKPIYCKDCARKIYLEQSVNSVMRNRARN